MTRSMWYKNRVFVHPKGVSGPLSAAPPLGYIRLVIAQRYGITDNMLREVINNS